MSSKLYSWDEIKQQGDCVRFIQDILGLTLKNGRCAATWRGGKNPQSVSVERNKFYDHSIKSGGSILDLCAVSKFGGDLFAASSFLGDWLNLKHRDTIKDNARLVATHQYIDPETNEVVHEELRFVLDDGSKKIRQRRPNPDKKGSYIYNLDGISPILYHIGDWRDKQSVIIVEGPKCADALLKIGFPATTNPMGAGYWKNYYNKYFKGKSVVILPDNDDAGIIHARHVAEAILDDAKSVRIVPLPDIERGEDVYEYLNKYNHTKEDLLSEIKKGEQYVPKHLNEPKSEEVAESSQANSIPFKNYEMKRIVSAGGEDKTKPVPRHITDLVVDVRKRFFGFPQRIGTALFDHDRKTNNIHVIRDCNMLFAWISQKSGQNYQWKRVEGCVSREELFSGLQMTAQPRQSISGVPHWPLRDDVYYTYGDLPKPEDGALNGFLDLFSFSTPEDKLLYKVFLATMIYYRPKIDRPIWVFDSDDGQGCFAPGTMVRMFDGSTKEVENVVVGDVLMGADSTRRTVQRLFSGKEEMFKFTYSNGDSHIVNKSHDLHLVPLRSDKRYGNKTGGRDGIIVPVSEYLEWSMRKKLNFGVLRKPITSYEKQDLPIPPYILGCWLGDGSRNATSITSVDKEVADEWKKYGESLNLNVKTYCKDRAPTIHLLATPGQKNPIRNKLRELGIWKNKEIPSIYMRSSVSQRLELIAGLIDTDGSKDKGIAYIVSQKRRLLAYQLMDLCRSVGISTTIRKRKKHCFYKGEKREGTYYYVYLNRNTHIIPVKIERKKIDMSVFRQKRFLHYAIKSVESLGIGQFNGFELDGDHLFLGADYTVLKNSGKTKAAEYAALLFGGDDPDCGEPLWVDWKQLENDQALQVVIKRLLSPAGRRKRMFLIDNVEGYFRSPALATLVTQGSISGMAPYGKGEETRPNDLVYVMTCNSATLSRDIISRSMLIRMKRAENSNRRWNTEVEQYIRENRMQIVAEIVSILEAGLSYEHVPATRFATWEMDVMGPILGDPHTIGRVWKHSEQAKMDSDADAEEADIVNETISHKVKDYVANAESRVVWIQSGLLADWCMDAIPGFGGRNGRNVKTKPRNFGKVGLLPRLKYPQNSSGKFRDVRGAAWIGDDSKLGAEPDVILRKTPAGIVDTETIY